MISRRGVLTSAAGLIVLPGAGRADGGPVVETAHGRLRGIRADGVVSFKGVRYGETTGGANRFLPPVPVVSWSGVRDADGFGASAPQVISLQEPIGKWYGRSSRSAKTACS